MNKIVVVNDKTKDIKLNDHIDFHIETYDTLFSITNIGIEISSDESLYLFISATDKKYRINIDVNADVHSSIYLFENVENSKVQYSFTLSENANLCVKHFNQNMTSKQMIETILIGDYSCFNYEIKKICTDKETSDFYIHHCGDNSISNLTGKIASINNATVSAQLSTFVEEGSNSAKTVQSIEILKDKDSKTDIKPNLYIDNNTATIDHNNKIISLNDFVELDFMIDEIYDKNLKEEVVKFLDRIGGLDDE